MIISTFSYLWSATVSEAVAELVDAGYDTFEVPVSSPHCWPDELSGAERSALGATLAEKGVTVRSLNAGGYDLNLASPAASMRRKSVEHIAAVINLAEAWGVPDIVISPGTRRPMISPPLEQVYGWMYESLGQLIPLAKQAGTRLLLENTPYCFTPTIAELAEVVRTVDDDAVKVVHDIANAAFISDDPVAALLAHRDAIALVHISDTGTDVWGHDPIGTGVVDWIELGKAVESTCGTDDVVLEIIREQNPLHEFSTAMRDLQGAGWQL
jgi:L-ribulose-5-phosphate 3-epimerase